MSVRNFYFQRHLGILNQLPKGFHSPHSDNTAHGSHGLKPQYAQSPPGQVLALWALYTQSNEGQISLKKGRKNSQRQIKKPNKTKPTKTKPNKTKPNQTKPNQNQNQTKQTTNPPPKKKQTQTNTNKNTIIQKSKASKNFSIKLILLFSNNTLN